MYPLHSPDTGSNTPLPAIALERHMVPQGPPRARRGENLSLCLDEQAGESGGYAITIRLPASYLARVSRIKLEAAPR